MGKRVYAYATIAAVDEEGNRVDYEPGTEITDKFPPEKIEDFLARGSAALYDRTKTPTEAAEAASEEVEALKTRVKELEEENEKLKQYVQKMQASQKQAQTQGSGNG